MFYKWTQLVINWASATSDSDFNPGKKRLTDNHVSPPLVVSTANAVNSLCLPSWQKQENISGEGKKWVKFSSAIYRERKQVAEVWFILPSTSCVSEILWTKKIHKGDKLTAAEYYDQIKISV